MKNTVLLSLIFLFGNLGLYAQNNTSYKNDNESENSRSQNNNSGLISDSSIVYPESMTKNIGTLLH